MIKQIYWCWQISVCNLTFNHQILNTTPLARCFKITIETGIVVLLLKPVSVLTIKIYPNCKQEMSCFFDNFHTLVINKFNTYHRTKDEVFVKDFFSKCHQIHSFMQIFTFTVEILNLIFFAVKIVYRGLWVIPCQVD